MAVLRKEDKAWQPLLPHEIAAVLEKAPFPWWIAGGHAIEAFVGHTVRPHGDIDILMLRTDRVAARAQLKDWDCWAADPPGTLRPWREDETLPATVDHIWCRGHADDAWRFQPMFDDGDGETCARGAVPR